MKNKFVMFPHQSNSYPGITIEGASGDIFKEQVLNYQKCTESSFTLNCSGSTQTNEKFNQIVFTDRSIVFKKDEEIVPNGRFFFNWKDYNVTLKQSFAGTAFVSMKFYPYPKRTIWNMFQSSVLSLHFGFMRDETGDELRNSLVKLLIEWKQKSRM